MTMCVCDLGEKHEKSLKDGRCTRMKCKCIFSIRLLTMFVEESFLCAIKINGDAKSSSPKEKS